MLKTTLTVLIASLGLYWSFAQQLGSIAGKIIAEGSPQEGVAIFVPTLGKGIVSDKDGKYELNNLPVGEYVLNITFVGYKSLQPTITIHENERHTQDFEMQADAINLGQFVVTGTRNAVPIYQSPVIVSTISRRTFEATQSLSLSEGLSFSPGLRLENNCQNCGFTQVRINGLEGPYSQILINNRPIFSALAGVYGLDMLPANMVDKIEVVRGGGSVLYGGNAIAGTINILTKDPIQNTFEVGLNQAFTDFNIPDRTLTFNGSVVGEYLDKGISFYGYHRHRNYWDANGDGFSEMTKLRNTTFGMDAFWNTSARSKLKLGIYNINEFRRGGNDFDLAPHQSDITEQLQHGILGANLSFEQYSKNYKHKWAVYSSAQFVTRDSYYGGGGRVLTPADTLTEADVLAINAYGKSSDISLVNGLQYAYEMSKKVLFTAGSEYQYNDVLDQMPGYQRKIDQQVGTLGNYAQLEWKPNERMTILAGGRYDVVQIAGLYDLQQETFEDQKTLHVLVPRFSMMYALHEQLKARVSFAQGYRAPQAFQEDLHIETVGGAAKFVRLAPNLITERSNSLTTSLNYTKMVNKTQLNLVLEGFFYTTE
ncbi:MAG: TonB-dependent receptor [Saprospiraceae bacterium]|nr:TonB-dependent receptor [Saprospiraceae bacterium]